MTQLALSARIWRVRAVSVRRAIAQIARSEPGWFILVVALSLGGVTLGIPRLLEQANGWEPFAAALVVAFLLEASRTDERLLMLLGANRPVVRVTDALLWLSPLLLLLLALAPRGAVTAMLGAACGAVVPAWRGANVGQKSRRRRPQVRLIGVGAIEWIAGLRASPWLFLVSVVGGAIGSAYPPVVVISLAVATLSATAYFWNGSEGWIIVHAQGRSARAFLWRKIGVSCGLLGIGLAPIIISAIVRSPSLAPVFALAVLVCLHTHACGIVCKYATYDEGTPLPASGTLTWMLVSAMVALPPSSLVALYMLERHAVARLAPVCNSSRVAA